LKRNRRFNKAFQATYWHNIISPNKSRKDKAYALLHNVIFTQAQPKLDKIKVYLEGVYRDPTALKSFKGFCKYHNLKSDASYLELFKQMQGKKGLGPKTTALFIKNIIQLHAHAGNEEIKFWRDVPPVLINDEVFLPVDAVIKDVFPRIDRHRNTFKSINKFLQAEDEWKNNLIWDDLWFWGFITQKGSKSPRKLVFNESKYWLQPHSKKDSKTISLIKKRGNEFIGLLKSK